MDTALVETEASGGFPGRFSRYLQERFPPLAYLVMITVFTFSAAAFSRLARGEPGFIPLDRFAVGVLTSLFFFLSLRILDEHKDADVDRRYRPELPVPRGLVTLAELRRVGLAGLAVVVALNLLVSPPLLLGIAVFAAWATLMTKEFFVREWLREHHAVYLVTHMAIMPCIDAYTTGLDWLSARVAPPLGIELFLVVTFLNGCVIEVGRKIRAPGTEREGVDTYTAVWGVRPAAAVWLALLVLTALTAWMAAQAIGAGTPVGLLLAAYCAGASVPGILFLLDPTPARARAIETASGLGTIAMYLLLGAGPFLARAWG